METLFFKRQLLNPFRYGVFSWMLFSHKVCRWGAPWAAVVAALGLLLAAPGEPLALIPLALAAVVGALALIGWNWPKGRSLPRLFAVPAFLVAGNVAVMHATYNALRGELNAVWEPTRREAAVAK